MNRIVKVNINTFYQIFKLKQYASFECSTCKKRIQDPKCEACNKMINYFSIFSIGQNYEIDQKQIKAKAKDLQKQYHPDKHMKENLDKKFEQYSAYINEAKITLLDNLKRAQYIMKLKGINVDQQNKIDDSQFMMEIFQLQEQIQQTNDQDGLQKLSLNVQRNLEKLKQNIQQFFKTQNLEMCKQIIFKYKYLLRASQNIKDKIH